MNNDFELDLNDFNEEAGFSNVRTTGIHDVTVKHISVIVKDNGVTEWSLTVNSGGEYDDTFYGVGVKFKTGKFSPKVNTVIKPILKLAGITNPTVESKLVDTKDGKKSITVYSGIDNLPVKLAVRMEWNTYKNKYVAQPFRVFNIDGRTATEVSKGETEAKQIKKIDLSDVTSDYQGKAPVKGETKSDTTTDFEVNADDSFDVF